MATEVVVPWRGGCPHRERARAWVSEHLSYPVRIGEGGEPWVKARAVAAACASAEIVVVHDADVWCPELPAAVTAVQEGAAWSVPHGKVRRLTETSTDRLLAGEDWRSLELEQRAYHGMEGGGIVVLRREVLEAVPLDPRFSGWSGEDESWGRALRTLAGQPWRGDAPLIHLWHPPQPRLDRRWGSVESRKLVRRYCNAKMHPNAMRQLLKEFA